MLCHTFTAGQVSRESAADNGVPRDFRGPRRVFSSATLHARAPPQVLARRIQRIRAAPLLGISASAGTVIRPFLI